MARRASSKRRRSPSKSASTRAGKFVEREMKAEKRGSGPAKSRRQAIAIGLSKARRAGVPVKPGPRKKSKRKGT